MAMWIVAGMLTQVTLLVHWSKGYATLLLPVIKSFRLLPSNKQRKSWQWTIENHFIFCIPLYILHWLLWWRLLAGRERSTAQQKLFSLVSSLIKLYFMSVLIVYFVICLISDEQLQIPAFLFIACRRAFGCNWDLNHLSNRVCEDPAASAAWPWRGLAVYGSVARGAGHSGGMSILHHISVCLLSMRSWSLLSMHSNMPVVYLYLFYC